MAEAQFAAALGIAPELDDHLHIPGARPFVAAVADAQPFVERAIALDESFASAWAALGNILVRRGNLGGALRAYTRALDADPGLTHVALACAEIAFMRGDERGAADRFSSLFEHTRSFEHPAAARRPRVLAVAMPGPWNCSVPLDFVIDPARATLDRWYCDREARWPPLDDIACAFVTIGESAAASDSIAAADAFVRASGLPFINDPQRLAHIARHRLGATLAGRTDIRVAPATRVDRALLEGLDGDADAVAELAFPVLVRPVDRHGGAGLERIERARDLAEYCRRHPADDYDLCTFVPYRDVDGYYRKYRVMLVDGEPFAYHAAIGTEWMLHAYRTAIADTPWMQTEEAAFLERPESVFPTWSRTMRRIASAIGLDYVGIDCARAPDGGVIVFEADTATLAHDLDVERFPYKRAPFERLRAALHALIERRCGSVA